MEPVGPWFSAASYNRLTNQQHGVSPGSAQEHNVPQVQVGLILLRILSLLGSKVSDDIIVSKLDR